MAGPYVNRRRALYRKSPYCAICGRKMRLVKFDGHGRERGKKTVDDDLATIDHIYSKLSGRRHPVQQEQFGKRTRLVCHRCNNELQRKEFAALPREEQWCRTGGYPLHYEPLDAGMIAVKMRLRSQWRDA